MHRHISRSGLGATLAALVALTLLFASAESQAQRIKRRHRIRGDQELSTGVGFAADMGAFTPGGFKWFNEYGHHIKGPTWFNLQVNVTLGDSGGHCYFHRYDGVWICHDDPYLDGTGLEVAAGVKLKWRAGRIPLQIHAKFGGAVDFIWFDAFYGAAVVFRPGFGLRYFFVPTFSVGAEVVGAVGPAFLGYDIGTQLYGAIDANFGIEWRF